MTEKELFKRILREVGNELKQMGAHGAHELAASLFTGSGYVMYPRAPQEGRRVEDAQHGSAEETQQHQERERGGRSM